MRCKSPNHSVNKGVTQGCKLSPDLFNIYISEDVKEWEGTARNGSQLTSVQKNLENIACR
jgi:hypothetical protein